MSKFGRHWSAYLKLIALYLLTFTLFRFVFCVYFHPSHAEIPFNNYLKAFGYGFRFDLRVALIAALPMLVFSTIGRGMGWWNSTRSRQVWLGLQGFITAVIGFIFFSDFGHYAYLDGRLSIAVLENLRNPQIAAQMVSQTYNLPMILLALLALVTLFTWAVHKWVFVTGDDIVLPRKTRIMRNATFCFLVILTLHGSITQYPLRWSAAFFSSNNFISSLGLNPVHYLVDTMTNPDTSYDEKLVQDYLPDMTALLNLPLPAKGSQTPFTQVTVPVKGYELSKQTNVIYIVMESYATAKMDLFGNSAGASPTMDELGRKAWLFTNFYTPTEGTARSMFCTVTGLTDISSDSTSSRNPLVVNQNSLINALKDHQKMYFLGGSTAWGNIKGVLQNNLLGLQIFEGDDFNAPTTDVWGLSDLDLFKESVKVISERAKTGPFFALIQSASYHRPYTIPKNADDFKIITLTAAELKQHGFSSNEEYNSFRFADYSLGRFFKALENEPFFKDTLFIIHGDHGLPDKDASHLGKGYKLYGLSRFHVPLIFYSPKLGAPRKIEQMTSQMDVMPTAMGLMGYKSEYQSLGRNALNPRPKEEDFAFSYVYYDRPVTKFLYNQQYLVGTDKLGHVSGLYDYTSDSPDADLSKAQPELFTKMSRLLHGYFESSRYLVHHNPKLNY